MTKSTGSRWLGQGGAATILSLVLLAAAGGCGGSATEPPRETDGGGQATLRRVVISPKTPTVQAGGSVQFQVAGEMSDGSARQVAVTYAASGGTVSSSGQYTAPSAAGSYRVVATAQGGGLADTATVTVTSAPPPPTPPQPGNYVPVISNDWRGYSGSAQLRAASLFWWYRAENVNDHVDLVSDPTFGQVARIRFQQSAETGFAPKMAKQFPAPLNHIWFRWRIKYTPGWTTVGPNPAGYANSWKMAFWTWDGYGGRGAVQLSNGDENILEWNVQDRATGKFYSYAEQVLPGGTGSPLGRVGQAWQDGEWYEYVIRYQRISDTQAKQEYWYRKLTSGGAIANNAYLYHGAVFTGSPMPRPAGIELGVNKNKSNPTTMYLSWGPWEVVDGDRYPNPFGMPNA